jgi:hypothetical protein
MQGFIRRLVSRSRSQKSPSGSPVKVHDQSNGVAASESCPQDMVAGAREMGYVAQNYLEIPWQVACQSRETVWWLKVWLMIG